MIFHDLQALGSFSPSRFPHLFSCLSICKVIESHNTRWSGRDIDNTGEEQNEGLLCLLSSWMRQTGVWCQLHWPTGWCTEGLWCREVLGKWTPPTPEDTELPQLEPSNLLSGWWWHRCIAECFCYDMLGTWQQQPSLVAWQPLRLGGTSRPHETMSLLPAQSKSGTKLVQHNK